MVMPLRPSVNLMPGDLVWDRNGNPLKVASEPNKKDGGKIHVDENFQNIRQVAQLSVQNGLGEQRVRYQSHIDDLSDGSSSDNIDQLFEKVRTLEKSGQNPKLLRYLDGELKYRMLRSGYHPAGYTVNANTLEL